MTQEHCTVIIHGLTAADAHRLVRLAHEHIGEYWARRVIVSPTATDWVVEGRSSAESERWIHAYGPWSEFNANLFVQYWNRQCGWEMYRARPVMTEQHPPRPTTRDTGRVVDLYR